MTFSHDFFVVLYNSEIPDGNFELDIIVIVNL